jgi:Aminopeptidase N
MTCNQTTTYCNTTGAPLYELKFHLYPNAYREGAKYPAVSPDKQRTAYIFGESWGGIDVTAVSCDSRKVSFEILGLDHDILTVTFSEPLAVNETVRLDIASTVTVPKNNSRFGAAITSVKLCHFYPVLCVFKDGEFDTSPYYCIGDPFNSDVANYFVELTVSVNGAIASTGKLVESTESNGKFIHCMEAKNVRDFAIIYMQHGKSVSAAASDTTVSYFTTGDQNPDNTLSYAVNCLNIFGELFGYYPYDNFDLVGTDFLYAGMEYPTLAYFSSMLSGEEREYVVAHEIAHQWWYGVVGTDGVRDGWLDEGLAEFFRCAIL